MHNCPTASLYASTRWLIYSSTHTFISSTIFVLLPCFSATIKKINEERYGHKNSDRTATHDGSGRFDRFLHVETWPDARVSLRRFYAGIRAGDQSFHLKFACDKDPSIDYVEEQGHFHLYFEVDDAQATAEELKAKGIELVEEVHDTDWQTREFVIKDDQGHTLYFGQPLPGE